LRFTYFNVFSLVYFWTLARYKALQVPVKHSTPLIFRRENAVAFPYCQWRDAFFVSLPVRLSQNETFHLWAVGLPY